MICYKCKRSCDDYFVFCPYCGATLIIEQNEYQDQYRQYLNQLEKQREKQERYKQAQYQAQLESILAQQAEHNAMYQAQIDEILKVRGITSNSKPAYPKKSFRNSDTRKRTLISLLLAAAAVMIFCIMVTCAFYADQSSGSTKKYAIFTREKTPAPTISTPGLFENEKSSPEETDTPNYSGIGSPYIPPPSEAWMNKPESLPSSDATAYAESIRLANTGTGTMEETTVKYSPAMRDESLYWINTEYNEINDNILFYALVRKQLDFFDGRHVEYEIYMDQANRIRKIISLELSGGQYVITDFYFNVDGKIIFVYSRTRINYVPETANIYRDGERFFFRNDVLTQWRVINGEEKYEYVIGQAELNSEPRDEITAYLLSVAPGSAIADFSAKEAYWIQTAYETLNGLLSETGVYRICGSVVNDEGIPQIGAEIRLYSEQYDTVVYTTQSDLNGQYSIAVPETRDTFRTIIMMQGRRTVVTYEIEINFQTVTYYTETACLSRETENTVNATLSVNDAFNTDGEGRSKMVSDALIYIYYHYNNTDGEPIYSGISNQDGQLDIELLPGCYTAKIVKPGYIETGYNFCVTDYEREISLTITPSIQRNDVRIVLTWDSQPYDLDSHLFVGNEHIYFSQYEGRNCVLDIDATEGYGPETITISNLDTTEVYKYYVADYTNCTEGNTASKALSQSSAKVQVYIGSSLMYTFIVPSDREMLMWEVFEIRNGEIVPLQRYYSNIDDNDWWNK